jgi:hypothetical protein
VFRCSSNIRRVLLAGCLLTALAASPARAQERRGDGAPTFDALVEQGLSAYRGRDYRRAVEKFLQANAMQPDPNLLFNLARCYEALGDTRAATEKYRLFLASPDAEPSGRQRAEDRLRVLRKRAAAPADTTARAAAETPIGAPPPPRPNRLAIFGAVAGAASVVGGALAYGLGLRDHQQITDVSEYGNAGTVHPLTEVQAQRLADGGRRKKTIGAVMAGAGGAVLAVSLVALLLPRPVGENVSVAMSLGAEQEGGGLLLTGRF